MRLRTCRLVPARVSARAHRIGAGPGFGDVAGRAADGIEKVAEFFEDKQIGDVVRDVERFARKEPALFVGAAFALGLIGGRFLKSSAPRRDAGTYAGGSSDYGDDDRKFLSDDDDADTYRYGAVDAYGAKLPNRTTLPQGSTTLATNGIGSSKGAGGQGSV